jgi:hypothetical protein
MNNDDDSDLYRLEGSKNESGGLIVKKKPPEDSAVFKVPAPKKSILGLDKLAGNFCTNLFLNYLQINVFVFVLNYLQINVFVFVCDYLPFCSFIMYEMIIVTVAL